MTPTHQPRGRDGTAERLLIARLTAVVTSFVSPDGHHKALRSIYSPKGVCQMVRGAGHHGLCSEMFDTLEAAANWLEAHPEPQQLTLLDDPAAAPVRREAVS